MREEILALAGVTKQRKAELLSKAVRVAEEAMDATETKFFSFEGKVEDERTVIDHSTRLAASDRVHDLVGSKQSKSASGQDSGPKVVVVLAPERWSPRDVRVAASDS